MTTITLPRAVVEQALEALKDDQHCLVEVSPNQYEYKTGLLVEVGPNQYEYKTDLAIAALERALAQQAEPLTIERLRDALVASRIIPPAAVEDPDGYDDGVTLFRIEALHRRIT